MLHLVMMGLGLILGGSMGGHNWLWGMGFGFFLAEFVRGRQRLGILERQFASLRRSPQGAVEQSSPASPSPTAVEASAAVPPPSAAEPATPARPAAAPVAALQQAREMEPQIAASAAEPAPRSASPVLAERGPVESPTWPAAATRQSLIGRGWRALWGFFSGGNPLVRVGSLVLLVGVAFLLKYIGERVSVPIETRLAGIAAGGIALLLLGIRLHWKRPDFAMPVQGAGLGVLFLTLFAAFRLYQVLPSGVAFALMLVVVAITVVLALWQDAMILAVFGVAGGFLAPLLASTGQGSHVELFTFYLILNAVVVSIAWFRAWRLLNWLGFVGTFGIGLAWGAQYYRPEFFAGTEPFLIAHVALYILVAVLFASRQPPRLRGLVDGTIVFGTPLVGFAMQAGLLADSRYGLAWSALVLGSFYLLLAAGMWWRDRLHYRLLFECFLALGVGFATLAIPLAFDARVTSAMWCVEGAAMAWVGLRQQRLLPRLSGYALMALGSIAYLLEDGRQTGTAVFLNADFLGSALVASSFAFVAHLLHGRGRPVESACWVYGLAWWLGGGLYEIHWQLEGGVRLLTAEAYLAVTAVACYFYGAHWRDATRWFSAWAVAAAMLAVYALWHLGRPAGVLINENMGALGLSFVTLAWLGWRLQRHRQVLGGRGWGNALGALAWAAWIGGAIGNFQVHLEPGIWQHWALLWVSLSLTGGYLAARPLGWPEWRLASVVQTLAPGVFLLSLAEAGRGILPVVWWGAWLIAFLAQYAMLFMERPRGGRTQAACHAVTAVSVAAVLGYGLWHWSKSVWGMDAAITVSIPALAPVAVAALIGWRRCAAHWPICSHPRAYQIALIPIWAWLLLWLQAANLGQPPVFNLIGFRPLLNVLDMSCLAVVVAVALQWRAHSRELVRDVVALGGALIGVLAFFWLNAALLRALHFLLEIPYRLAPMWASFSVQASVTLLWVLCALTLMIAAARTALRWVWIAGAALMGLAVIKLFLVDTAASGTLARIVAFFGVAGALFLAGYLVPRPPASSKPE